MKKNAKKELKEWIGWQKHYGAKYLKTSEILAWGVNNCSNRAERNARSFKDILKRISREEAVLLGFTGTEGVYELL